MNKKTKKEAKSKKETKADIYSVIEKEYGKGSVVWLGEKPDKKIEVIPTGSIGLDKAVGIGGYPRGRIVEIYGPESSGKTTLTLHAISEAQKKGLACAFIDVEHAFHRGYAEAIGVNTEKLLFTQPDSAEMALGQLCKMVESGELGLIVVDSVAALTPQAEIDGEAGKSHVGIQARLMGQAMRKLTGFASKKDTTVIFINQIRHKIGVMFGSPETTSGGNALKFYASLRLDVRRTGTEKVGDLAYSNKTKVKVVKNKCAPPFRLAEFSIVYGQGIERAGEVLDFAVEAGHVARNGAFFYFDETKLGQGRPRAIDFLKQNEETFEKIKSKLGE